MTKYTIFCQQSNRQGTMHISDAEADTAEEAAKIGKAECMGDWDYAHDRSIDVVGIARVTNGEIEIVEWNDFN